MNKIPNSGRNLEITSATAPSKNSSHNYRTPFLTAKLVKKNAKIMRVSFFLSDFLQLPITFSFLDPNTFITTLFSNTLNLRYSHQCKQQTNLSCKAFCGVMPLLPNTS
jgi:hypothetical protein